MVLVRGAKTPTYQHLYVNQVRSPRRPPVRGGSAQRNVFLRHDRQLTMFSPQDGASSKTRIMDVVPLFSFDATARCMESVGGRSVWTADFDGSIRVRNATKGNELRILEGRDGCFCTCILHVKSSNAVWLSFSDGFVRVYDVVTYALLDEFTKHDKAVECMLELEGRVYTGGRDWQIFQWNPDTFTCERHFSGHNNAVRCMCSYIGETGAVLFSGGDDGTVRAWDPYPSQKVKEDNGNIHTFEGHSQGVLALALVATNNRLWSGGEDTTIRVWDLQTLSCVTVLEIHSAPVNCLAVIGSRVWSGDKHGKAFLWDVKTMTPIKDLSSYMTNSPMSLLSICQVKSVTSWRVWMACSGGNICCWNADANPLVFEGCGTGAELMDVGEAFHLVRENKALREELDRLNGYATRGGEDGTPQRFKGALATSRWRARSASYAYPTGQHPSRNGSRERQASYSAERENAGMRFLNSSSFSGEPPVQATATVRVNRENESQVVISTHERFFYGESWESVLKHNLDELRNVLGREGSFALDIPMEHLKLKELRIDDTGRGFFVTLEVRHSMGITNQEVDTMLREYPFVEVYELYGRCLAKKLILYGELPAADEDRSKKQTGTQQQADGLHKVQQDVDKLIRENKELQKKLAKAAEKASKISDEEKQNIVAYYEENKVRPRIVQLEKTAMEKEEKIKGLRKELEVARREMKSIQDASEKADNKGDGNVHSSPVKKVQNSQKRASSVGKDKQKLQDDLDAFRRENQILKDRLERVSGQFRGAANVKTHEERKILLKYEREDVKPRIKRLEEALSQKEKHIKNIENELDAAQREVKAMQEKSAKEKAALESEERQRTNTRQEDKQLTDYQKEKQKLQDETNRYKKECETLKEHLKTVKRKMNKLLSIHQKHNTNTSPISFEDSDAHRHHKQDEHEEEPSTLHRKANVTHEEREAGNAGDAVNSKQHPEYEIQALKQTLQQLKEAIKKKEDEATSLTKENEELRTNNNQLRNHNKSILTQQKASYEHMLATYEEEDVKPRIEKLEQAVAQRDEALLAKEKLIKRLEKDLDSARHEARAARRDSTKSGSSSINKAEDAHMKELEALRQKVEALAQEKQRLQEEATHSRKECDVLKECLEEAKHSLSKQSHFDAEERRGMLTAYEEEDVKPRIEKLEHAVAQRDEALLAKEKLIKRLEKDLDSARHEARAARRDSTKSGSSSINKAEDAHMKELEALQQKVEALAQEKQRLQEEATHSRKECDVLKECLEEAKHSLSKQSHFDAEERRGMLTAYEEEDVKPRIEKLEHAVAQRDEALLAKEKLIKRLEKDLDSARHEARAARRDSTKSGSSSINKAEDAHMKELEALQQKVEALVQEKQRLQEEATHSRKECDVLKECLEEAKHSLSKQSHFDAEERRGMLTAYEEEDVKPRIEKLEQAVAQRDEALLAKEKLIKRLEKDLDSARHEARAARRDSTKSGSSSINKAEDAHMKELEALQQKVEALAQEKQRLQEEATHSRKECDVLKECLEEAKHSPSKQSHFDAEERRGILTAYEEEDVKPRIMLLKNILKEREEVLYCMENRIKLLEREVNFCRLELKAERKDVVRDCCPQDLVVPVEVSNDYGPLHSPHVVAESHKQRFSDAPCASGSWNTAVCGGDKEEMQLKRELSPAGEEKRSLLKFYEERDVKPRISLLERAVAERDRSLHTREEQIMMLKLWLDAARRDLQRDLVQRDTVSEELLTTLKDQLRSMEKENRRFQEETICFKRENDVLKQRLFDIERRIRRPSSFMESERQKVLCTYEEEHVRPRIARLERAVTQRDQTLHLKDEQIKELEKELNDLRLEGRQVCIDDTSNRTQFRDLDNALASEIIMIKEQMNTMAKEKLKMQDEVMCYRQENHALRERIAAINSKLKKCSIGDDVSYLKPKIMHLEQVVAQREQSLCSRDKKIEVLEKELEDIRRKVREAHDENVMNQAKAREKIEEKLQEEIQALQDRVGDMEMDRKRKEEEAISLKKDNEMLNNRIMELEASEGKLVIPLSASPNSVSTNREVLMTRLGTAIEQVHHVQREREAAERRVTVLQEDCRNLRMKLQSVSSYPSDFLSSRYHHSNQPRQLRSADESISMEQRPGGMTSFPDSTERLTDSVTTTPNKLSDCLAPFRGSSATTPSGIGNTGQQLSMEDESYVNMLSQHDEVSRRS
uniref:Flagellar attachment zone protein 1 conserved domain-containing protein n=1 Tax=Trypanosoma congolense (strain IL3000) TaxID=1068625 RepID=G0UV95_TRYCI|nr:conserved hypothetical protein [Trypanosoma congolense IL3000]